MAQKILDYLKSIYPRAETKREICSSTRVSYCTVGKWLRTLVADRKVEICGKKGRCNLYRYIPESDKE